MCVKDEISTTNFPRAVLTGSTSKTTQLIYLAASWLTKSIYFCIASSVLVPMKNEQWKKQKISHTLKLVPGIPLGLALEVHHAGAGCKGK